ncbi:hypothetical protein [Stomatohabitans albus]|uniref:hypothetical protein n=1 Tax=Stomatohabitans albus TaxID=3110766 RepID=UPI00300D2228
MRSTIILSIVAAALLTACSGQPSENATATAIPNDVTASPVAATPEAVSPQAVTPQAVTPEAVPAASE